MIIIVEGADCSGKTTFVAELRRQLHTPSEHVKLGPPNPPDRDVFEEYEQLIDRVRDPLSVTVCDRLHWGERVYGPIFRGVNRLDGPAWRHVELFLASRGALVVYLHKPTAELAGCLTSRGDDMVEPAHVGLIEDGYAWCLGNTILPVLSLRWPGRFEASHVATLAVQRLFTQSTGVHSYIGVSQPDVLLFGDRRGPTQTGDTACFVPRPTSSGHFLLSALPEWFWPRVGVANASEERYLKTLWMIKGKPPVVALGREAQGRLVDAGVPHSVVPHPQYVRRFHHGRRADYGQLIADVAGKDEDFMGWFD